MGGWVGVCVWGGGGHYASHHVCKRGWGGWVGWWWVGVGVGKGCWGGVKGARATASLVGPPPPSPRAAGPGCRAASAPPGRCAGRSRAGRPRQGLQGGGCRQRFFLYRLCPLVKGREMGGGEQRGGETCRLCARHGAQVTPGSVVGAASTPALPQNLCQRCRPPRGGLTVGGKEGAARLAAGQELHQAGALHDAGGGRKGTAWVLGALGETTHDGVVPKRAGPAQAADAVRPGQPGSSRRAGPRHAAACAYIRRPHALSSIDPQACRLRAACPPRAAVPHLHNFLQDGEPVVLLAQRFPKGGSKGVGVGGHGGGGGGGGPRACGGRGNERTAAARFERWQRSRATPAGAPSPLPLAATNLTIGAVGGPRASRHACAAGGHCPPVPVRWCGRCSAPAHPNTPCAPVASTRAAQARASRLRDGIVDRHRLAQLGEASTRFRGCGDARRGL